MDIDTVREILCDLDLSKYLAASKQFSPSEEVWPGHVEDAFLKAVDIFASVGQKKYQVDDKNAKGNVSELVGRNDIISRYIYMKTGRYRSRKQVSSHIQVWAHCKKPPSSRNMTMDSFNDLQTVLRLHYSRPSTAFGQPKKKLRRVVSTSNVSVASRLATVDSLGIRSTAVTSQPCLDDQASERKHNLDDTTLDHPAKRYRRVVSELPPTSLGLLFECGSDGPSLDFSDASSAPFWSLDCRENVAGTPVASDQSPMRQLTFEQAESTNMRLPLLLPTFDVAVQHSPSIYELSMATAHGTSAATLTAATIAAIAGFEEAIGNPMIHATIGDNSLEPILPAFAPAFHDCMVQPACVEMISAFAAVAAATPACSLHDPVIPFGHTMDAAAASVAAAAAAAAEECNQALVEAFGRYYAESALEITPDMQFPFCGWSEAAANDGGICKSTAVAATEPTSDPAPSMQRAGTTGLAEPMSGSRKAGLHAPGAPVAGDAGHLGVNAPATKLTTCSRATRLAAPTSAAAGHSAPPRALPLTPTKSVSTPIAMQSEYLADSRPNEYASDLRSSPSCTQSTASTSRASDKTLEGLSYSDGPAAKGASGSIPTDSPCHPESGVELVCDNGPVVIDWLNRLKNLLDIDSCQFADSACQAELSFSDDGGCVWPFVFAHQSPDTG
ncbi:hypothetical protein GGI20_004635 [Coemansia sp. BCRC 34301]|nr:hypothetical protein GGI20_004635 [Coemansia sp. BCRC 34301]